MEFRDGPDEATFRIEVRDFIARELPPGLRQPDEAVLGVGVGEDMRDQEWLRKLATRGWVAPAWPKEYGGAGMSVAQQFVYNEEMARARAPRPNFLAIGLIGPTIIVHGSDEQKKEYLPGIMSGEVYWCQGFSEPGSGSDLASLQSRAVQDGDDYVINGQKIWTSGAHRADKIMVLARTDNDVPKHKGISCFVVDMRAPGISVQPLTNMAEMHSFNEVFFDNVRVPRKDMIGEINRGWYVATTTLDFERSGIISAISLEELLKEIAEATRSLRHDGSAGLTAGGRLELADRFVETRIAIMFSYRIASMQSKGLIPNMEASIMKLYSSELAQRIALTASRLGGLYGQLGPDSAYAPMNGRIERMYRILPGSTLAGGTSEIQRNIIAQRGLGMPRE